MQIFTETWIFPLILSFIWHNYSTFLASCSKCSQKTQHVLISKRQTCNICRLLQRVLYVFFLNISFSLVVLFVCTFCLYLRIICYSIPIIPSKRHSFNNVIFIIIIIIIKRVAHIRGIHGFINTLCVHLVLIYKCGKNNYKNILRMHHMFLGAHKNLFVLVYLLLLFFYIIFVLYFLFSFSTFLLFLL